MTIGVVFLCMLLGAVVYLIATKPGVRGAIAHLAIILFACALLVLMFALAGRTVHLF